MTQRRSAQKTKKEAVRGLTGISVCGYKSLVEECHIDLRRLTILAGANNSGKSSIIQPLLMLKQTLDAPYDPGPIKISGPNVQFTDVHQFLPKIPGIDCPDRLSIRIEVGRKNYVSFSFSSDQRKGLDIDEISYDIGAARGTLRRSMTRTAIKNALPPTTRDFEKFLTSEIKGSVSWAVDTNRCFIGIGITPKDKKLAGLVFVFSPGDLVEEFIRQIIHVPGLRGNPERFYKTTAIGPDFPGIFSEYVASIIRHWKDENDGRLTKLGAALKKLGLTWKVDARPLDATRVEIQVGRMPRASRGGARDMVSIADVGFGVSQVLPVVVALLTANRGQLVYIEQPEIHLHPGAQVAMAELLADAANRGVRLLIETHSSFLLLAIQALIAKGALSPERVKLHWFTRRADDGVTTVQSAHVDDTGAFGDWPVDFGDVALELEGRYLDLAERRLKHRKNAA